MDVDSTASVVSGHDSVEGQNTVVVTELDATEGSVVQAVGVVGVAIATGLDTTVDTSGVAVPSFKRNVREGLAGGRVDELDIKSQRNTGLCISDILANELTRDP